MNTVPWDQRVARRLVRPLAHTSITPNQVTLGTVVIGLGGCLLIAIGGPDGMVWGASLFVLSRFLDHFDGELARIKGMVSRAGYYLDYAAGGLSYGALFLALGFCFQGGAVGDWAVLLGLAGTGAAVFSVFTNMGADEAATERGEDAPPYPAFAGFELEDGIYLLVPVAWLGWLEPFFIAASAGATVYFLWSLSRYLRLR